MRGGGGGGYWGGGGVGHNIKGGEGSIFEEAEAETGGQGGGIGTRRDAVGAQYHIKISGIEPSVSLASVQGLEHHHPTTSMLWGHIGRFKTEIEIIHITLD